MLTPVGRPPAAAHPQLRRQARQLVPLALTTLVLSALILGAAWQASLATRWLLLAGLVLGVELWMLFRYLGEHVASEDGRPLSELGPGNLLTLGRGLAVALMSGFLVVPRPSGALAWVPALLYTIGALLDLFDGYAARRAGTASRLGEILDVEYDALAVLLVTGLAIHYGNLPLWFLPLGAARYLFMWGQSRRRAHGLPVYPLTASQQRRVTAGTFMGFLTIMLWPPVNPPGTYLAALIFSLPYAAIFIRDWLVASGAVNPSTSGYRRAWIRPAAVARYWLPLGARLTIVAATVTAWAPGRAPAWADVTAAGWHLPVGAEWALNGLALVAAAFVGTGILTRLAALPIILAASADVLATGLHPANAALLAAGCSLPILGGGRFTLWEPESRGIFRRRLGETAT